MIDVTDLNLRKLVANAYNLSVPVGLGFLHATDQPLSEGEIDSLIREESRNIVSMDYVNGRQCKFNVVKENDKLMISDKWYDHTDSQLETLLELSK